MQVNMHSCLLHDNIPARDVYNKSLRLYSQTDLVQNIFPRRNMQPTTAIQ